MTRRDRSKRRRGVVMAEAGIVYSVTILLLMGSIVAGLGVFRYQEVTYQARLAARWASVQAATPSSSAVLSQLSASPNRLFTLDPANLTASVTTTTVNSIDYVSVTLTYAWVPEVLLATKTFTSTSTQPKSPGT